MRIKKAKVLQAKFYINIMIRFGKKEKGDHSKVMDGREETRLELKYQIQDPVIFHVHELNIVNAETS